MEGSAFIKPKPPEQVGGRTLTHLKNLTPEARNRRLADLHESGALLKPTQGQWATLGGGSTTGIAKALNGHRKHRTPSPAPIDLGILLHDIAETALRLQWRSAQIERSELEDVDRLIGAFRLKHESAIETWRGRGGTAGLLAQTLTTFDRLLTTILSNNNIG